MKIISGKLKGRVIKGFDIEGTRPTMDRVKESLFSSIQEYVPDSVCLDLFSGSGNLGFEALSNNAKYCYFNDKNFKCINLINKYIKEFNLEESSKSLNLDYNSALSYFKNNNITFDIIFLDPPYKFRDIDKISKYIYDNKLLNENGLLIIETDELYFNIDYYKNIKEKKYGDKYINIYKNIL